MSFLIVKTVSGVSGEQILIYPPREGDQIYEYPTLAEAQQKISQIQGYPIYSDCSLEAIQDNLLWKTQPQ